MLPQRLLTQDLLLDPLGETNLGRVVKPRFAKLLALDHQGWMTQLKTDGFTDPDIEALEGFLQNSFNEGDLAERLSYLLTGIQGQPGEYEINDALVRWTKESGWNNIWEAVCSQEFPDPFDAAAYVGSHLLDIASSTVAFEMARGEVPVSWNCDWNVSESEVKEGLELAETGLSEEAAEWPPY